MKIYSYIDYRKYIKDRIASLPLNGRGQLLRLAKSASIHSSVLSQVFQGQRDLTSEQAVATADYFGLSDSEARYFHLLVQLERASTQRLKALVRQEIDEIREREEQIVQRIPVTSKLSDEQKALFYSNWFYSGARVLSSITQYQDLNVLSERLRLTRTQTDTVAAFLLQHGLCIEAKNGKIKPGPQSTHIDAKSPITARHHANWRIKAMEKHSNLSHRKELAYTAPLSLSEADAFKVRALILEFIESVCKVTDPSASETAFCLNIDWFEF